MKPLHAQLKVKRAYRFWSCRASSSWCNQQKTLQVEWE